MSRRFISFISPCFNEEDNIDELYRRVCAVMAARPGHDFEYLFIDNASTDRTVERLRAIAASDPRVRVIVNTRNFGHIRSPYWGLLQTTGEATILLASDLQDPPELIPAFLDAWESGHRIVMATKPVSRTNALVHLARRVYYRILDRISEARLVPDATGFGLYDRSIIQTLREIGDPYPYLRGLIASLGHPIHAIAFVQPRRLRGITKNNFYTLYDIAMLGIVSHSMVPLRLASLAGFATGLLSLLAGLGVFVAKLIWWDHFTAGLAPVAILLFGLMGAILLFIGILGEYVGSIHTYVKRHPVVIERERINFPPASAAAGDQASSTAPSSAGVRATRG
jgi:dolichol-phosphate mannosyltransferase